MLYRFACLDAHDNAVSTEEIDARSLIRCYRQGTHDAEVETAP